MPKRVFTMPESVFTMSETSVHDDPKQLFMMDRNGCSRWSETSTPSNAYTTQAPRRRFAANCAFADSQIKRGIGQRPEALSFGPGGRRVIGPAFADSSRTVGHARPVSVALEGRRRVSLDTQRG